MSNSQHLAVRDAMVARLLTAPAVADGRVVANRRRPMPHGVGAQVFVYLENSQGSRGGIRGAPIDWTTLVRVESVSREGTDAADALASAVYERLLQDIGLGGLAQDLYATALAWDEDEADTTVAVVQTQYAAVHRTRVNTLGA